ncbi:glucosyltransferase domain-containing protein [Halomonas sp. 86]|uniref:glucosyltransferase domain-containing protein n=1 Tax=unclassified Halomonas TaxID=2609666 RepID=UPI0040348B6B
MKITKNLKYERNSFIGIAAFFTISYFWTFIAGHYQDDKTRQLWGGDNWSDVGRPLADILTIPFKLNDRLSDITPISQLISIFLITVSVLLCKEVFSRARTSSWIAFIFLFANVFYIQNMSYRFDNQIMTLSFFCSLLSATMLASQCKIKILIPSNIALFLFSLCLYQAAINVALVMAGLWIYQEAKKDNLKYVIKRFSIYIGCLIIALILYKIVLFFIPVSGEYGEKNSGTLPLTQIIPGAFNNYYGYARYAFKLNKTYALLVFTMGVLVLLTTIIGLKERKNKKEIIHRFLGLGIMASGTFGILLILNHQALVPRVYMGLGALSSALCFILLNDKYTFFRYSGYLASAILIYNFIFYSSVYGNVLKNSNQYESETIPSINENADILATKENIKNIAMVGILDNTYRVKKQVTNSRLIARMIDKPITNYMSARNAYYFYGGTLTYNTSYDGDACSLEIEETYPLYDLRVDTNDIVIVFREHCN